MSLTDQPEVQDSAHPRRAATEELAVALARLRDAVGNSTDNAAREASRSGLPGDGHVAVEPIGSFDIPLDDLDDVQFAAFMKATISR